LLKYREVLIGKSFFFFFSLSIYGFSLDQVKVLIGHYIKKQQICLKMDVIFDDKNDLNVCSFLFNTLKEKLKGMFFLGNRRDMSCRMPHDRDSNNSNRRNGINNSLDKSTTSTGSGQRSPLSSASDKSCDEQLLLMQQQQQQLQRPMYMQQHQQQQQTLESPDSRNLQVSSSSTTVGVKPLKQEQCDFNQMSFDPHTFAGYSPFAINTLMLHQGFGDNPAALNAYYASQLPQTAFVPSSSSDYYHHPAMYAPQPTAL
jgi:hypothetical protein